jgi:hypothetical protein
MRLTLLVGSPQFGDKNRQGNQECVQGPNR